MQGSRAFKPAPSGVWGERVRVRDGGYRVYAMPESGAVCRFTRRFTVAKPIKAAQAPVVSSNEAKSATPPRELAVESLLDGRLRVIEPIKALWREEDEGIVVEAAELNEFGFGDNLSEAMADLQAAIAELYFTLEREQHELGPDLAAVWATLARKLRRADVGLHA